MADQASPKKKRIIIQENGPYQVQGDIPLVHKTQVVTDLGEPLTWRNDGPIQTAGSEYDLCRCGQSGNKPFCDSTHCFCDFDGTETASTEPTASRQRTYPGGVHITIRKDHTLCMDSGFCGLLGRKMKQIVLESADSATRSMLIAMVERCPSGSLTYSIEPETTDIEPDLPQQIAVSTEITSDGPIAGPLNVTGYIEIERSDGTLLETRNRVTLCNCGHSSNKPFCDGTHRREAEAKARAAKSAE
jgi:CDGSH-type Zn-finger protein